MYTNMLLPANESEFSMKAVRHGIARAKRIDSRASALTVLPPFHTFAIDAEMIEDTRTEYNARMQERAEKTLGASPTRRGLQRLHARRSRSSMTIPSRRPSILRNRRATI